MSKNYEYFELELSAQGEVFKGLVDSKTGEFADSYGLYHNPHKKLILISSQVKPGGFFDGYGMSVDYSQHPTETIVYYGQLSASHKQGLGVLQKVKGSYEYKALLLDACNKDTYARFIDQQVVERARKEVDRARVAVKKVRDRFMSEALKEVIKKYNKPLQSQQNQGKKPASSTQTDIYIGEFQEDKRHGWGVFNLKLGDKYKGQFEKDLMEGRGIYKFNANSPQIGMQIGAQFYIGELKENAFHGLGRMVFRDGTQYFGSFNFNQMQSARAIIKYPNGDQFKGGVNQNMKQGPDCTYTYHNGDQYWGDFRADRKEGSGKLFIAAQHITYEGEFKDDRKCGKCVLYDFGPAFGKYTGPVNQLEELDGKEGRFEFPGEYDLTYEGEFKDSMFHGQGKLTHADTGNTYEGQFYQHHKDGACVFTLAKTGQQYKGTFEFNYENKGDYGPRF